MSVVKQDLLVVIDATASMGSYLTALTESMPEILSLSKVSGAFDRIGVLAYRDYCDARSGIIVWSEWNNLNLAEFTSGLLPDGGGDYPEAAKTGLIRALEKCDPEKQTLVLWYADAPPHAEYTLGGNAAAERRVFAPGETDWVKLAQRARERNCSVFSFVPRSLDESDQAYYVLLSQLTGGSCLLVQPSYATGATDYSRLTLDIVIHWVGLVDWNSPEVDSLKQTGVLVASLHDPSPLSVGCEELGSEEGTPFIPSRKGRKISAKLRVSSLDLGKDISSGPLAPTFRSQSIQRRFADPANEGFRKMVYTELEHLIDTNVYVLTFNPVFGQLWRAVCKYGDTEKKIHLANTFSLRVSQVTPDTKRWEMQKWLEESFDSSEEIEAIISKAKVVDETVWVYLDLDSGVDLTRKEMLEVTKSCYSGVLKKLATIFTHLKVVDPSVPLPPEQRKLPLSLPPRELFRLLPHLVVPGTLFPARAASLTAILALVTGVPFLASSAAALLQPTRGTWLDLEVPENISYDCARFLLSAPEGVVLTDEEKEVYAAMKRYRLLELNLESTLLVEVPWTPEKTREVGDWKVKCAKCKVKRSVSIMSHEKEGECGFCASCSETVQDPAAVYPETDEISSCWVECSVRTCRAQYVVENVAGLRVRPKCHYCRTQQPCPHVECTRCANRIVVPAFYHTPEQFQSYLCPGCANTSGKCSTIVPRETTTKSLVEDNGVEWLSLPPNKDLLQGKSAFKLVQAQGFDVFREIATRSAKTNEEPLALTLEGKRVHNANDVLRQIEKRVGSGEVEQGTCTLCFDDKPWNKLVPCCGRRGCAYRVDEGCLQIWYGANEPGKLLNLMQVTCPFCRRMPSSKILARFNRRVVTLGGLRDALVERGWYHAWCLRCGFAKRAYERQCCEGGRLPDVQAFVCGECTDTHGRQAEGSAMSGELKIKVTECPGCGVMVEKTDGCNHISCPCGQHFCHVCGKGTDEADIYIHMSTEHGGIYDNDDGEYENDF